MISQYPGQDSPKRTTLPSIHLLLLDLPTVNFQLKYNLPVPVPHYGYRPYIGTGTGMRFYTPPESRGLVVSPVSLPENRQQPQQYNHPHGIADALVAVLRTRSSSDPVKSEVTSVKMEPSVATKRPFDSVDAVTPPGSPTSGSESEFVDATAAKKNWKPRKKRQCPECKLYFLNLATHKLTHLKPTSRPHICKYCDRGFARPNDLFRHVKCHWKEIGSDKGQFKCPFKRMGGEHDEQAVDHCCHNTGIFLRCDTFKNHLKAIHFQYPNGTKKDQRMKVPGKCRMCQKEFANVDEWLVNHVEKSECAYALNGDKEE